MQRAELTQYGEHKNIVIKDANLGKPGEKEILVKIFAAGVNPFDYKVQSGALQKYLPLELPVTLGGDFAGKVLEVGLEVTEFAPGDRLYGQASIFDGGTGSFAEMAFVTSKTVARMPKKLNYQEAASLPLAGVSALQAIFEHFELKFGQRILIHGAAGGIGTIAIQMAKYLGAYVATTASGADHEYVKNLGADLVLDYKKEDFSAILEDYDAVFDTVGGEVTNQSLKVLKMGGILVSMLALPNEKLTRAKQIKAIKQNTKVTSSRLIKLAELVDQNAIEVQIEKTYPMKEVEKALSYLRTSPPQGKVVLLIK